MIQHVDHKDIGEIFRHESRMTFHIPKYQREYVWTLDNWETLYKDIFLEEDNNHYLGTIITINTSSDSDKPDLEIIDGQQRLTTLSLLFCAFYRRLKKEDIQDDSFISKRMNLRNRLVLPDTTIQRIVLSSQNNNNNDYKYILHEIGLLEISKKPPNLGNRRIYKAFKYFCEELDIIEDHKTILNYLEKIIKSTVVKIEVSTHSDAFTLFESLNNRGVPLSAIDIIKNKALSEIDRIKNGNIDTAFEKWQIIIDNLPEYDEQEKYLRHLYNCYRFKEEFKVQGCSKAQRTTLIKIYETLFKRNPNLIYEIMVSNSSIYRSIINPVDKNDKNYKELRDLDHIGATPSYSFILYLYTFFDKTPLLIEETLKFLVKFFFIRNITNYPRSNELDSLFVNLIDYCQKKDNLKFSDIHSFFKDNHKISEKEIIISNLKGSLYIDNVKLLRFILCKLEENKRNNETAIDFWVKDHKGKYEWSIEHILPEGKNLRKEWIDMLANGNKEHASQIQDRCVHKLGNLTLTKYNSELSNFDFIKKNQLKDKNAKSIGYQTQAVFLNESIISNDSWNEDSINNRTDLLIKELSNMIDI